MSSSIRSEVSPGPQIRATPGAFPTTPGESESVVSSQHSLSKAVYERRAEYTVPRKIRIKVGTWNVAALPGTEKDIGSWFVDGKGISESLSTLSFENETNSTTDGQGLEDVAHQEARRSKKKSTVPSNDPGMVSGGDEIGLYVLGLQEIMDVSSAAEALKPYYDPWPSRRWKRAVEDALPKGYVKIAEHQLIGLFMLIYAAPSVAPTISSVSTASAGTGLMGYLGNKGAVVARLVLGETTRLVFINCHLAAGAEKGNLERRNWDASQVSSRAKFDPLYNGVGEREESGENIGDEDFAFWFGDLNYRLEGIPGDDVRRLLMLHTKNEYGQGGPSKRKISAELALHNKSSDDKSTGDTSNDTNRKSHILHHIHPRLSTDTLDTTPTSDTLEPSSDPASLQTTLSSLLQHDQLHQQMRTRKAFFDGWREGPINFLPTYKYDVGSVGMFDSSEKKRGPSWCDRILYRTRRDKVAYEERLHVEEAAKKRDQEMKSHGIGDPAVNQEEVLFDNDPTTDGADDDYNENSDAEDPEVVTTAAGFEDKIHLECYTSHQRVLSSDHKPLDAIFTLHYEAVDSDLKAKVHQEVARELDKAENESRPAVTVVIDHHHESEGGAKLSPFHEGVEFGDVRFDSPKTRTITVANTGRVPATVGFTDRIVSGDQIGGDAPPWLRIRFDRPSDKHPPASESHDVHTLEPGDAANVDLTVHVNDSGLVGRLNNEGHTTLEDVLVLRIHNGRDHFLPVHATWLPSSFGRSIGNLPKVSEGGIRKSQDGHEGKQGVKWSAPREIFRLTESIENLIERAVAEWGMKANNEKPPWEGVEWPFTTMTEDSKEKQKLKERIIKALDDNTPIPDALSPETDAIHQVEAVATILRSYLLSLQDGVISEPLWNQVERALAERDKSKTYHSVEDERMQILDILATSPAHSTSFTLITSMLVKVIGELSSQSMDPTARERVRKKLEETFASTFSEVIVKAPLPPNLKERRVSLGRRKRVIEIFIEGSGGL
ncbi:MAG: hypothetical protein Q9213_002497 [Squamulea squamosa]